MKTIKLSTLLTVLTVIQSFAQQSPSNKTAIQAIIDQYSKSVIQKDSTIFYSLFIEGPVTWTSGLKDRSVAKTIEQNGGKPIRSNVGSASYKSFMRAVCSMKTAEDKFDNIKIVEDGEVASVTMDYSFWPNGEMSNWGGKYLLLIKKNEQWKITSVIYSIEDTEFYPQPTLKERLKGK